MLTVVKRELLEGKYKGKLEARYEAPQHTVVAQVFRGLVGKKVITPSKDFVRYDPDGHTSAPPFLIRRSAVIINSLA